jgi:hypothetical protein
MLCATCVLPPMSVSVSVSIARWAMGDATTAVLFVRECLHMDSVIEVRLQT